MHEIILVEILNCLADVSEVAPDQLLAELAIAELDLLVQTTA